MTSASGVAVLAAMISSTNFFNVTTKKRKLAAPLIESIYLKKGLLYVTGDFVGCQLDGIQVGPIPRAHGIPVQFWCSS